LEVARNLQPVSREAMQRLDLEIQSYVRAARSVRAVLLFLLTFCLAGKSFGQCVSNASSCVTCHETEGKHPVLASAAPWHVQHGFGDLCVACHGGDPAATDKSAAHLGRGAPLGNPERTCKSCHDRDSDVRASRYLAVLGQFPSPPVLPEPVVSLKSRGAASRADFALALVAVVLAGAFWLAFRRQTPRRRGLVAALRAPSWSPFAAGALLGLVVAVSQVRYARPVAVAGAFDKLAAYPGRWLFPGSQYYAHIMQPGIVWPVWVVLGIFIGAYASAKLSGSWSKRWLPETQWQARFGAARITRLMIAFLGAVLVQVGAGIAGGCTSGLAISGGALLAPAAFLFMGGMFAAGIPTALLWYRKRRA
jgi:hypothetical protein